MYAIAHMDYGDWESSVTDLVVVECEKKDMPDIKRRLRQHSCYEQFDVRGFYSFLTADSIGNTVNVKKLTLKRFNRLWEKEHKRMVKKYVDHELDWPGSIDYDINRVCQTTFNFDEVREKLGRLKWNRARCDKCGKMVSSKAEEEEVIKWCTCGNLGVTGGKKYVGRELKDWDIRHKELSEYEGHLPERKKGIKKRRS